MCRSSCAGMKMDDNLAVFLCVSLCCSAFGLERPLSFSFSFYFFILFFFFIFFFRSNWLARSILFSHPCHWLAVRWWKFVVGFHMDISRPNPIIPHNIHMCVCLLNELSQCYASRHIIHARIAGLLPNYMHCNYYYHRSFVNSVTDIIVNFLFQYFCHLWNREIKMESEKNTYARIKAAYFCFVSS